MKMTAPARPFWIRMVKPPASPPARIVIEGPVTEDGFQPTAVRFPEIGPERTVSTALMPGSNVLPLLGGRLFGVEERVEYRSSGSGFAVRCMPGQQPAGVVLGAASLHFPRGVPLKLVVSAEVESDIGISIVAAGTDAPAEPMTMLGPQQTVLAVPIARWSPNPQTHNIVLTCPPGAADAVIRSLMIVPARPP